MAIALLLSVAACGARGEDEASQRGADHDRVTKLAEPRTALSEKLMVTLALAKNHHHKADVYLKQARIEDAVAEVKKILTIDFDRDSAEGEDVMLDARARLAKLLITQGALDEAMRTIDEGIAGTQRQSFFVANLHSVRGEVFEARAVALDDSDPDAAKRARHDAIRAFDRSIDIDKALLEELAERGAQ